MLYRVLIVKIKTEILFPIKLHFYFKYRLLKISVEFEIIEILSCVVLFRT